VSLRLVLFDENLALTPAEDVERLLPDKPVRHQLDANGVDLDEMTRIGNVGHNHDSSSQFIPMSLFHLGMLEVGQAHAPSVIGWPQSNHCCGHRIPSMIVSAF